MGDIPEWLKGKTCEVCGEQAMGVTRHLYDKTQPSDFARVFEPSSTWHYRCEIHQLESLVLQDDGMMNK